MLFQFTSGSEGWLNFVEVVWHSVVSVVARVRSIASSEASSGLANALSIMG